MKICKFTKPRKIHFATRTEATGILSNSSLSAEILVERLITTFVPAATFKMFAGLYWPMFCGRDYA